MLSQTQPRPTKGPTKLNNYLSSHRSSATLPPIIDMRTPRKSVPTSQTPKINSTFMHNSERTLAKVKANRPSIPSTGRASAGDRHVELPEKTLPDIATHRELLQKTPIVTSAPSNKQIITDMMRDRTSNSMMANPYVSQKLRNSAMRIGSGTLNSPISSQVTANAYG